MNELKVFENQEFGRVRVQEVNGEPWLVGKDVCEIFGDTNHNRSLARVEDEDKRVVEIKDNLGRTQNAVAINESGLYALLFAMQPQKANKDGESDAYPIETQNRIEKLKKFKRWVTSEVLPSIRKHGMYATDELLANPDFAIKVFEELKNEREEKKKLQQTLESQKPKVLFAESVETSKSSILVGDLSKLIKQNWHDIGQNRLFDWLRDNGYLIKGGESKNMPTQMAMELGLFEVKERAIDNPDGSVRVTRTTKVTGKGQIYFINKFIVKAM